MCREKLFLKRGEDRYISGEEILGENFRMIWSTKNPISQTDRRIYYDVWLIGEFLLHGSKKLLKVDTVDMVMDKFKTMDFPLHLLIIICSYDDFFKRKAWNIIFVVLTF